MAGAALPRPPLLPKIGLLSPQCGAKQYTPLLLMIPLRNPTIHIQPLLVQVVEKSGLYNLQASPPEPSRPGGNGHRGSQVCPHFPTRFSHPPQKGQMSLNCFQPGCNGSIISDCSLPHPRCNCLHWFSGQEGCGNMFDASINLRTHIDNALFQSPAPPSSCARVPGPQTKKRSHYRLVSRQATVQCSPGCCCYLGRGKLFSSLARPISTFMPRAKKYLSRQ